MSLTEARLTEGAGMRGLEAASNRVREDHGGAAPWSPTDLATLSLWLDPTDATKLTIPTGTEVSAFASKAPSGYVVSQATSGNRPLANTTINGLPALFYDGSNDFLRSENAPINNPTNGAFTCWVVFVQDANVNNEHSLVDGDDNIDDKRICQYARVENRQPQCITFDSGGGNHGMGGSSVTEGATSVIRTRCDGPNATIHLNGTQVGSLTQSSQKYMSTVGLTIGGQERGTRQYWHGKMGDIIACSAAESAPNIALVDAFILARWGV